MGWEIFYDPFRYLSKSAGAALGAVVIVVLAVASWITGAVLDGALDLHLGPVQPSLAVAGALSVIDWLALALCLLAAAAIFRAPGRDVGTYLWTVAVARWPMVVGLVIGGRAVMGPFVAEMVKPGPGGAMLVDANKAIHPVFLLLTLVLLGVVVWNVAMLVFAFKRSSGLACGRLAWAVVVGLVAAEVVSKLAVVGTLQALS
jgi:hypothetical protein